MTTFAAWAARSDSQKIYLVELNAVKVSDLSSLNLYLSNVPFAAPGQCYIACVSGLPRLTRTNNNTLDPNHVSSWGELEVALEPDYKPDAGRTTAWNDLLSPAYSFLGQPVVIKLGGEDFAYADFQPIFTGRIGGVSWKDNLVTFTIYDKSEDLAKTVPDFEMPESSRVVEDSWGQTIPLVLGSVKNYKPVLINSGYPGIYPYKYALAAHVLNAVQNVYFNGYALESPNYWIWTPKDVSPVRKDGEGSVIVDTYGPYTGALLRAKWIIEIDSLTALNSQGASGSEVGLATFRWKLDGDAAWRGEGLLTWKLGVDTLVKSPAAGNAGMTVSGDYTGDCKLNYKTKITRGGHIGDAIGPQFIWSDDGGVTWKPDDVCTWTPVASAPGVMSVAAHNPGDSVLVEITTGGNVGGAVRFKWSRDGGATWDTDNQIPDPNPIELFSGYSVQFTAPGEVGVDDYDAGDAGGSSSAVDILDTGPIALNRGLSAAFTGAPGSGVTSNAWIPIASAPGVGSVVTGDPEDVTLVITLGGACGVAEFNWIIGVESGSGVTSTAAQEISPGYSVQFTAPGTGGDDYDIGDSFGPVYTPPFVAGDVWSWTFKEVPIPLGDGVSIQFVTQAGQDFYLWDEFAFILLSTLMVLTSSGAADITLDAQGMSSPATGVYADKIGEMIRALCVLFAGWDPDADFDTAALTAFNLAIPYEMGLVVDSPTEISQIIDDLLTGVPCIYTISLDGKFFIAERTTPSGEPVLELTDVEIISHEGAVDHENLYHRVYLHYNRNFNTNQNAEWVSQERLEWLRLEWRQVSRRDEAIMLTYPWARDLGPLNTALVLRSEAVALADKILALYKVRREKLTVGTKIAPFTVDVGNTVRLKRSKFSLDAGVLFVVEGLELDATTNEAILNLWR